MARRFNTEEPDPSDPDYWRRRREASTTTSTTTPTTSTTAPSGGGVFGGINEEKEKEPLGTRLQRQIESAKQTAYLSPEYTAAEVESVASGKKEAKGITPGKVTKFIFDYTIGAPFTAGAKALDIIDTVDNMTAASAEGIIKNAKVIAAGGEKFYETQSEIPLNKQTKLPIAKVGDLALANEDELVNYTIEIPSDRKIMTGDIAAKVTGDFVNRFGQRSTTEKYKTVDEIPVHKQTLQPLAKVGDYKITNDFALANMGIRGVDASYVLPSEVQKIYSDYAKQKGKYQRAIVGGEQFWDKINNPKYGWGSIPELQTGNKWVDRVTGFTLDVLLSPSTYVGGKTATSAKAFLSNVDNAAGYVDDAARIMIESGTKKSVNEALTATAQKVAVQLGEKETSRIVQRTAAAIVADAANLVRVAADDKLAANLVKEAENLTSIAKTAVKRWGAIGPARVVGAANREALASSVNEVRKQAQVEAVRYAGTARGRAAQNFVDVITEDVVADIAMRGYPALKGKVAEVLGTPGGLRFGVGTAKFGIPGTEKLQLAGAYVGRGVRKTGLAASKVSEKIPFVKRSLLELVTPQGKGGLPISDDMVFQSRTLLRSGQLRGNTPAAMAALDLIKSDEVYRALRRSTASTVRQGLAKIFSEHPNPEARINSHKILNLSNDELIGIFGEADVNLEAAARYLTGRLGIVVTPEQVAFNKAVFEYLQGLGNIIDGLSWDSGAVIINSINEPDEIPFPQVLSDKAVSFLGRKSKKVINAQGQTLDDVIERTLIGLGLDSRPAAGNNILNEVRPGNYFFGTIIPELNPDGSSFQVTIDYLNKVARENLKINFDLFDTDVVNVLNRYSQKFANDYAFVKRVAETSGEGAARVAKQEYEIVRDESGIPRITGLQQGVRTTTPYSYGETFVSKPIRIGDYSKKLSEIIQAREPIMALAAAEELGYYNILNDIDYFLSIVPESSLRNIEEVYGITITREFADTVRNAMTQLEPLAKSLGIDVVDLPEIFKDILEQGELLALRLPPEVAGSEIFLIALAEILPPALNRARAEQQFNKWSIEQMDSVLNILREKLRREEDMLTGVIEKPKGISAESISFTQSAIGEVEEIMNVMKQAKASGDSAADAWRAIGDDLAIKYQALFSQPPERVIQFVDNISPTTLKTMVNLFEDAYVVINNTIVPDLAVRADLAQMFNNVRRLKNPTYRGNVASFIHDFTRTFKGWVTAIPGFHTRNFISNTWQMIAAGAEFKNMTDGLRILKKWNQHVKNLIKEGTDIEDVTDIVNKFLMELDEPKSIKDAVRATLLKSGSGGGGDLEEVFGAVISDTMGVLGKQTKRKVSQKAAAPLRLSRKTGSVIEDYSRFILTFDGIRQGLDPQSAAARTRRFLFDYEDLTELDVRMKQIMPFWVWMSRNLPLQAQEMFHNPKLYQQYKQFRANFEDENGDNVLIPAYLRKAGAFSTAGNVLLKPDLGIPGAGAPTPLVEGITEPRALLGGVTPLIRVPYEIITGEKAGTGQPLEGGMERYVEPALEAVPPVSWLGRLANLGLGGRFEEPWFPGISKTKSDTTPGEVQRNAILSFLGIPATVVTPSMENQRRYEILQELNRIIESNK